MAGSDYWSVIGAVVAAYFANKGQNGGTPNQYPVELPPEAKRVADEAWNVYKAGGSPIQKEIRGAAEQYIGGMPTTAPDFAFQSDELKGKSFAGGITLPKIDLSKLSGGTPTTPTPTGKTPKDFTPRTANYSAGGALRRNQDVGMDGTPFDSRSIQQFYSQNPGATGRDFYDQNGTPQPTKSGDFTGQEHPIAAVRAEWEKYKVAHPNWKKEAARGALEFIGAALGLPVMEVTRIVRGLIIDDVKSGGIPIGGAQSKTEPPPLGNTGGSPVPPPTPPPLASTPHATTFNPRAVRPPMPLPDTYGTRRYVPA